MNQEIDALKTLGLSPMEFLVLPRMLALALDPEILFFDEPSAGLDPVSARRLDNLILQLSESLGTTMVVVTHELASIFTIGNNSVFLDASKRTMTATGNPNKLLAQTEDPTLRLFLTRGVWWKM